MFEFAKLLPSLASTGNLFIEIAKYLMKLWLNKVEDFKYFLNERQGSCGQLFKIKSGYFNQNFILRLKTYSKKLQDNSFCHSFSAGGGSFSSSFKIVTLNPPRPTDHDTSLEGTSPSRNVS